MKVIFFTIFAILGCVLNPTIQAKTIIACASDLSLVMKEIVTRFGLETPHKIELVFGSSGQLAMQIHNGAPYDVFLSADQALVEKLHNAKLTFDKGLDYANGRLVLYSQDTGVLPVDSNLEGLRKALQSGKVQHFAIANPQHAPYGQRAREVLQHLGLWSQFKAKLVIAENASQAVQFIRAGGAEAGLVPLSLVIKDVAKNKSGFATVPEDWHKKLTQRMVLIKQADPTAKSFYSFLQTKAVMNIFREYGYHEL